MVDAGFIAKEKLGEFAKRSHEVLEELVKAAGHGIPDKPGRKTVQVQASKPTNTSGSPEGGTGSEDDDNRPNAAATVVSMAAIQKAQREQRRA